MKTGMCTLKAEYVEKGGGGEMGESGGGDSGGKWEERE